jgi:zinc protease
LKPTDFKNDQVIFDMEAQGGASLAPCADLPEATLATSLVRLSGIGGIKALDLQKMLAGKIASASASIDLSTQSISGGGSPADLETALSRFRLIPEQPCQHPYVVDHIARQLAAAVANREQAPQQVFGERMAAMNTSNHCVPAVDGRARAVARSRQDAVVLPARF